MKLRVVMFPLSSMDLPVLWIVLRFVSEGCVKQRLVKIAMLSKSLAGEELARELVTALSTELGTASSSHARPCIGE